MAQPAWVGVRGYTGRATRWGAAHLPGGARTLWTGVGLILLALLIWAIRPGQETGRPGRGGFGGPQSVGINTVAKGDIPITLNALGTVTPLATVTVRPQVSGQILRFNFTEGQMVKAGDLLAEIDPRAFRAAYDQAQGQLERDRAALGNAQVDLKRDQALYAAKAISQQVLDTQAALVRSDAATVKSDAANVEATAINLGYTKVTAPVAGRVGLRQVDVGNLVQAGQTNGIVVVTQLQPVSVLFSLPEDNISDIMARVHAGATLSVEAYDRGQTVKLASGNARHRGQPDRHHDRHGQAACPVRQCGERAVPQSVRQCASPGEHAARPDLRARLGDRARLSGGRSSMSSNRTTRPRCAPLRSVRNPATGSPSSRACARARPW